MDERTTNISQESEEWADTLATLEQHARVLLGHGVGVNVPASVLLRLLDDRKRLAALVQPALPGFGE